MDIKRQTVLVTGGSRGLGEAVVRAFAREGANVVINYYQSKERAENLAEKLGEQTVALQGDVRSKEAVEKIFKEAAAYFKTPITTIVNNALVGFSFDPVERKNAEDISWEDFSVQFEGSVQAALNTAQAGIPDMKAQEFGRIVNIGTNLVQNPVVPYHDYTSGKAALLGLTRTMARDLGPYGITVNMASGGLLKETDASKATSAEVFQIIQQNTPLQRVITPEEMADAVLLFASPLSRAVTGQNLIVDGGLVMK